MTQFDTVLIANRGEIAHRIIKTVRKMGLRSVAIYTAPDKNTPHVLVADEAIYLPELETGGEPYLDINRIIEIAKRTGAKAIHPGYGFLSENSDLAKACAKSNIVFIGPTVDNIRIMADKAVGKITVQKQGVPCVPGYDGQDQSGATLKQEATKIGTPLLIKAVAGGGGRGMRRVDHLDQFEEALTSARSEAQSAFGSSDVILEKYLTNTRHIEVQVFGDQHRNIIHLGERDCSVQRRQQKVIEEAPSPFVKPALREKLGTAAVKIAQAIGYIGAGTIEFLVTPDQKFFFIEMNTRLQVEHPVTEEITGLDLVEWQIRVAAGEELPLHQNEITFTGAAIEVRIYAEDPTDNFLPQTGTLAAWYMEASGGIRFDHMMISGNDISARYDPMIGKLIAYGATRNVARKNLIHSLKQMKIKGILTNRSFLLHCLNNDDFKTGKAHTGLVDQLLPTIPETHLDTYEAIAAAILYWQQSTQWRPSAEDWSSLGTPQRTIRVNFTDKVKSFSVRAQYGQIEIANEGGHVYLIALTEKTGDIIEITVDGSITPLTYWDDGQETVFDFGCSFIRANVSNPNPLAVKTGQTDHLLQAPMSGQILSLDVSVGDEITAGQTLIILEAMKMEHRIRAVKDGLVVQIPVSLGDQVSKNDLLIELNS